MKDDSLKASKAKSRAKKMRAAKASANKNIKRQFFQDLAWAASLAKNAAAEATDLGPSNFDSCAISLQNVPTTIVIEVLEALGLYGDKSTSGLWKGMWIVSPPVSAQGYKRTKAAQVMAETLRELGYRALFYGRMD